MPTVHFEPWPKSARPVQINQYRDIPLFLMLYSCDGVLTEPQLVKLLTPYYTRSKQGYAKAVEIVEKEIKNRLRRLTETQYLKRNSQLLSNRLYMLAPKSYPLVAEALKQTHSNLRFRSTITTTNLYHDLGVIELYLKFQAGLQFVPNLKFKQVIFSRAFRSRPLKPDWSDTYKAEDQKNIVPDLALVGQLEGAARLYFPEYDGDTEDCTQFVKEKVIPHQHYIRSRDLKLRFNTDLYRVPVTTPTQGHRDNLKRATEAVAGKDARIFAFAVEHDVTPETIFTEPIWYVGQGSKPMPLLAA